MTSPSTATADAAARLVVAVAVSAALHGAALHALSTLPRGWQSGAWLKSHAGLGSLRATLRAAAPGIVSPEPEAQPVAPPPPPRAQRPTLPDLPQAGDPPLPAVAARGRSGDDPQSRQPLAEPGNADAPSTGVLAAPVYLPASQLDQRPQIKVHVEPRFPQGAPVPTGRVVLRLYIGEQGEVEDIAVIAAEPPGVFEKSALEAFAVARFTPGIKSGQAVRSLVTIEVFFGSPVPLPSPASPRT